MGQIVQSLRSPLVGGRKQLMMKSESPAMAGGHPLTHLPVGLSQALPRLSCVITDPSLNLSEAQMLHWFMRIELPSLRAV